MMTVLIFLSIAHRTDNGPPEGLHIHIHILIPVAQPFCDVPGATVTNESTAMPTVR